MSKLKNLFGGNNSKKTSKVNHSEFGRLVKTQYTNFDELLEQHAALSYEKQTIFSDVTGSTDWQLDMEEGIILFGELTFPIQIIGSLAFESNSWMWAWANTQSAMPENLLIQSNQLKKIGQDRNIEKLMEGHFNIAEGFEHKVGMIASGLFNSKSYYSANYGQGTLIVTIDDSKIPAIDKQQLEKTVTVFPQLISAMDLNHKNTFLNYLIDRDFSVKVSENKIEGICNNKIIVSEFDASDRLTSLKIN